MTVSFDLIDNVSFDLIDNVSFDLILTHGSAGVRGGHAESRGGEHGGGRDGGQLGRLLELEGPGGQRGGRGGLGLVCQVRGL